MATPNIPPRPQRSQAETSTAKDDTPIIPPRPIRKNDVVDDRELYSQSPLNSLPGAAPIAQSVRSEADMPRRPPSVSLPGIGQEGSEYSSYDQLSPEAQGGQTKSVSADLPMHQPIASVPQSTATRQIATVTRTDSASAAAAGIGKPRPSEDTHQPPATESYGSPLARSTSNTAGGRRPSSVEPHPLRARESFNRSTSSLQPLERTTSRPGSVHGDHHHDGIPEIGRQIPLYPNAGDVQAPSPAPGSTQYAPGIGYFNDGTSKNHTRKRSTRQEFGPPDSYGLRHDPDHRDQFERAWKAKHPEEAKKEEYYLHVPRPPSALTSEQLNRLVDQSTPISEDRAGAGTPDEEDVLDATEEYNARKSPLKGDVARVPESRSRLEAENADDNVVRVYPNSRRTSRISVGSVEHALESSHQVDHGYSSDRDMPILAADEVIKRPNSAFMHAAVNPNEEDHYESDQGHHSRRNSAHIPSRPSSRPSSVHGNHLGGALHRFTSHEDPHHTGGHTPLEEIEEYDPLFPDDDDGKSRPKKKALNRPDMSLMHHFPSRDTWEDTPDSLQYSAEVSTPDLEREQGGVIAPVSSTFETPEAEQRRITQNPDDMLSDKKTFIKPHFKNGSREHLHGVPRFPSSDVWEDTPDSMRLETTVSGPQMDDTRSAPEDRPTTNVLSPEDNPHARASTNAAASLRPSVPARPERSSHLAQEVTPESLEYGNVSDKPKPSIPARPARTGQTASGDDAASTQKVKPAVPARPSGEKFSNLRGNAGFLNDLNNRLKLGPQGPPPKKESESDAAVAEEQTPKAPLADARKGRAKGPMRRKPGATTELKSASFALSPLITVWSIDEEDELQVESETHNNAATSQPPAPVPSENIAPEQESVETATA